MGSTSRARWWQKPGRQNLHPEASLRILDGSRSQALYFLNDSAEKETINPCDQPVASKKRETEMKGGFSSTEPSAGQVGLRGRPIMTGRHGNMASSLSTMSKIAKIGKYCRCRCVAHVRRSGQTGGLVGARAGFHVHV